MLDKKKTASPPDASGSPDTPGNPPGKLSHAERRKLREAVIRRLRKGETVEAVAASTGYTVTYIRVIGKQAGVKVVREPAPPPRSDATREIIEALAASDEPITRIAQRFGVSRQWVHDVYLRARAERADIPERFKRGVRPRDPSDRPRITDAHADPTHVRFAREFSSARERLGLTQAELGRRMGVSQYIVTSIEMYGDRPPDEILDAASRALGVDLSAFAPPPRGGTGRTPGLPDGDVVAPAYSVGDRVKALRVAKGWTQEALASAIDPPVYPSAISTIELGKMDVSPEMLARIAKAFGVDRSQIDVELLPARAVSLVREWPHARWVGMTDDDKAGVDRLIGPADRPRGMGSGTVATLVEKAGDEGVAVIVRGDLGVQVKPGAKGPGEWVKVGKTRGK